VALRQLYFMQFAPRAEEEHFLQRAVFAAGCFWVWKV